MEYCARKTLEYTIPSAAALHCCCLSLFKDDVCRSVKSPRQAGLCVCPVMEITMRGTAIDRSLCCLTLTDRFNLLPTSPTPVLMAGKLICLLFYHVHPYY